MTSEQKKHLLILAWYSSTLLAILLGYLMGNFRSLEDSKETVFKATQEQNHIITEMSDVMCKIELTRVQGIQRLLELSMQNNKEN